jgi:hypothetical protein
MNRFKLLALTSAAVLVAVLCFTAATPKMQAQVSIGVNIGDAPDCPYGYYDYSPYSCAPYGYYGPEWFTDGAFVGAGPWFHGHDDFRGHVDNHYDVQHGYKGTAPKIHDKPEPSKRPDRATNFRGNEMRDGRGHTFEEKH